MDIIKDVLDPQMKDIFNLLYAKDCFELKQELLKTGYTEKNEYEKNEIDIERIKVQIFLSRINKEIRKKIKELKDNIILFEFSQNE
jgi:predicted secreted Zn-dependent protease